MSGYLQRNTNIIMREEDEDALLYDPSSDRIFIMNWTASIIWNLCDGTCSSDQIKDKIKSKYKVSDEVEKKIDEYISFLIEKRLITMI